MNKVKDLVKSILYFVVKRKEGYVTKTKLLKYLYLIDIEHYRIYGKTFTGFNWKFYKYGPWTKEFEKLYNELVQSKGVRVNQKNETQFLNPAEDIELGEILDNVDEKLKVEKILARWSDEELGKMLNYVYFYTEPMEGAVKNMPLDFSKIEKAPAKIILPKSSVNPKKLKKIQQKLRKGFRKRKEEQEKMKAEFKPPNYDEVYFEAVTKMDEDDDY